MIDYIELPCTDLSLTKTFYTAAFGWEWVEYGPTYAASTSTGLEVALNAAARVGPAHGPGEENAIGPLVLFQTDDLGSVEASVRSAGGDIVSPPYGYPGGRRFHFADPSGNVLGVYQRQPNPPS
ncbi:MAG: VOC family protein [Acidimicrobiales bacterium]